MQRISFDAYGFLFYLQSISTINKSMMIYSHRKRKAEKGWLWWGERGSTGRGAPSIVFKTISSVFEP